MRLMDDSLCRQSRLWRLFGEFSPSKAIEAQKGLNVQFNQESNPENYSIRSYGTKNIDIQVPTAVAANNNSERSLRLMRSFIMTPQCLVQDWQISTISALDSGHFEQILALKPEIILLGTGHRLEFPNAAVTKAALENGIGVESMDSSAACRTYNILMLEGRNVAVAVILA